MKLKIISEKYLREQQFQHHGCQKSARTSLSTCSKIQIGRVQTGELMSATGVLGIVFTHLVISQAIKNVRVWRHEWVEQNVFSCSCQMCASGNFLPRRESQRGKCNAVERYYYSQQILSVKSPLHMNLHNVRGEKR